ncbi:hypothetical protein CAPTEDRAFT_171248 [Capitella teleta]|uniref:dolichyl-phosphate-mannose--protein mannosyltransferase n=1 Tax=Capitella teleta TaxID=283909 RepID=R7V529_CAPTE|nr:hypothetical protein CAPTEDRAFT_171248 [Capitella teleta]|eukprot:ELU11461.1 hypothetical protein CAPTEDRAFT_171248 [Capitella teleta]
MDATVLALPALLAIGLYLNTLSADFAYDDSRAILKNADLHPSSPLWSIFLNDFWGTPLTHSGSHKSYRPLCVLSFRLNCALGGLRPFGFHLFNVALHGVVSALFSHVAYQLLNRRRWVAVLAGAIFASHPIHTEAVAGIVGRADLLACLFFLLALLCYMRFCKQRDKPGTALTSSWGWFSGMAVCTCCAMLCKEQGVTVLAVCAIYDAFLHSRISLRDLSRISVQRCHHGLLRGVMATGFIGVLLVSLRVYFMGNKPPEFAPADNPASDSDSILTRTLTFLYLPFVNFWLLLCPRVLSFDWSMGAIPLVESCADLRNLCTLTFYSLFAYTVQYVATNINVKPAEKPHRNGHHNGFCSPPAPNGNLSNGVPRKRTPPQHQRRSSTSSSDSAGEDATPVASVPSASTFDSLHVLVISFALLIFPFIPATNLFFYVGFVIAERVLYIPSMGFALLVAHGAALMAEKCPKRRIVHVVMAAILLSYAARTVLRNADWLTEEALYRSGIAVNPAKAWGNLANILNGQGKSQEAEAAYKAALSHRGNMADVHYNLGILYQEQEKYQDAIASYKRAIQCRPRLTMAHLNLGIVYSAVGLKADAEEIYRHCADIDISGLKDPRLHENTKISALYNLGRLLADHDRHQEAIVVYEEAIQRRPAHYSPQSLYNMMGESHFKLDHIQEAEKWYRAALKTKPDHAPAHLTMGKLIQHEGDVIEAEKWFLEAKRLDPKDPSVHQHYGQFLADSGRYDEAAERYLEAVELSTKEDFELVFNTANVLRQAGRNQDAEKYYYHATRLKPKLATAHMNLGAMLHFNGRLEEAEKSYLAALKLQPADQVTQANLQKLRNLRLRKGL